jgi:hypothetical protein
MIKNAQKRSTTLNNEQTVRKPTSSPAPSTITSKIKNQEAPRQPKTYLLSYSPLAQG